MDSCMYSADVEAHDSCDLKAFLGSDDKQVHFLKEREDECPKIRERRVGLYGSEFHTHQNIMGISFRVGGGVEQMTPISESVFGP